MENKYHDKFLPYKLYILPRHLSHFSTRHLLLSNSETEEELYKIQQFLSDHWSQLTIQSHKGSNRLLPLLLITKQHRRLSNDKRSNFYGQIWEKSNNWPFKSKKHPNLIHKLVTNQKITKGQSRIIQMDQPINKNWKKFGINMPGSKT